MKLFPHGLIASELERQAAAAVSNYQLSVQNRSQQHFKCGADSGHSTINTDITMITGNPLIDSLDLKPMIIKLSNPDDPLTWSSGWKNDLAVRVGELYKTFLFLMWKYPNERLIPTREIDEFWHAHILFTEKYSTDCQAVFGYYVHHYPHEKHDPESQRLNTEHFNRTLDLVRTEFPGLT